MDENLFLLPLPLQLHHYEALLDVFKLKPSRESKDFGDLVLFVAQVLWAGTRVSVHTDLQ